MIYYSGISYKDRKLKHFGRALMLLNAYIKKAKPHSYIQLVTCNRIEIYSESKIRIKTFRVMEGKGALRHLFKVTAGIDSMLIGEHEICVQVKNALENSKKHCSSSLASLFQCALKTAKKIRSQTKINRGRTSIPSIAVEMIMKKYKPKKAIIVGSGICAGKIAKALSRKGVDEIILSNRHFKRAMDLAKKVDGKAAKLSEIKDLIKETDVVFSATSCPVPVIYSEDIPKVIEKKQLVLVDLACPYDIEKKIDKMKNVKVIRLEHLQKIAEKNIQEKRKEADKATKIIEVEVSRIEFI